MDVLRSDTYQTPQHRASKKFATEIGLSLDELPRSRRVQVAIRIDPQPRRREEPTEQTPGAGSGNGRPKADDEESDAQSARRFTQQTADKQTVFAGVLHHSRPVKKEKWVRSDHARMLVQIGEFGDQKTNSYARMKKCGDHFVHLLGNAHEATDRSGMVRP